MPDVISFFRDAPYGAIVLFVLGTVMYIVNGVAVHNVRVRRLEIDDAGLPPDERLEEARKANLWFAFVALGCVVAGAVWGVVAS